MEYTTFNEAFQDYKRICVRNIKQGYISGNEIDPSLDSKQRKLVSKILTKIRATDHFGKYSFKLNYWSNYDWSYNFEISNPNGATRRFGIPAKEISKFFDTLDENIMRNEINSISRSFNISNRDDLVKVKNIFISAEKDINDATNASSELKRTLAIDLFMFKNLPSRDNMRRKAYNNRISSLESLRRKMRELWIKEHPLQCGSEIVYRYMYNGYEHGERKPGRIEKINGDGTCVIKTAAGRCITKAMNDIFRTGNTDYGYSEECRVVTELANGTYKGVQAC